MERKLGKTKKVAIYRALQGIVGGVAVGVVGEPATAASIPSQPVRASGVEQEGSAEAGDWIPIVAGQRGTGMEKEQQRESVKPPHSKAIFRGGGELRRLRLVGEHFR